ncbi:MAG: [citrate (pro-3S)-lyase] ligase [Clostridiaceae bacterium]|jgi:[citrate (pro-3S)-lyase] ligase|nr:[citrate (pro-3S)-lyase] ligase [Clostridiaceae bacterium]
MQIRQIWCSDKHAMREILELLNREGLSLDANLEYTAALYDDAGVLRATASFYQNTLRCLAVDRDMQGEGLMAQIVSHLVQELFSRGRHHLFVYTKRDAVKSIAPLGFYEIVSTDKVVFLENKRDGFGQYIRSLNRPQQAPQRIGAVVMNANPFSLGHQHLVEHAASECDALHLFVVSEDVSAFPFAVRERLVRKGTAHIPNIFHHSTGPYLVSSATFPSYFISESDVLTLAQARLDAKVFGRIAHDLGITDRFVGDEPLSPATALYNLAMSEELPQEGVRLHIIPRIKDSNMEPISSTRVRAMMKEGRTEELCDLVPESTYTYIMSDEGKKITEKLRESR